MRAERRAWCNLTSQPMEKQFPIGLCYGILPRFLVRSLLSKTLRIQASYMFEGTSEKIF